MQDYFKYTLTTTQDNQTYLKETKVVFCNDGLFEFIKELNENNFDFEKYRKKPGKDFVQAVLQIDFKEDYKLRTYVRSEELPHYRLVLANCKHAEFKKYIYDMYDFPKKYKWETKVLDSGNWGLWCHRFHKGKDYAQIMLRRDSVSRSDSQIKALIRYTTMEDVVSILHLWDEYMDCKMDYEHFSQMEFYLNVLCVAVGKVYTPKGALRHQYELTWAYTILMNDMLGELYNYAVYLRKNAEEIGVSSYYLANGAARVIHLLETFMHEVGKCNVYWFSKLGLTNSKCKLRLSMNDSVSWRYLQRMYVHTVMGDPVQEITGWGNARAWGIPPDIGLVRCQLFQRY